MGENHFKQFFMAKPIENHETASWSNVEKLKDITNVAIPNEVEVWNAKEWVDDENQK